MKKVIGIDGQYVGEIELKGIDGLYEHPEEIHAKVDEQIPGADTWSEGNGDDYILYNSSNNIAIEIPYTIEEAVWYAVQDDEEDDWSEGSYDFQEACRMVIAQEYGLIAVIDGDTCIEEIPYEDIDGYWVTTVLCGTKEAEGFFITEEDAEAECARLNKLDKENGGTGELWEVI